MLFGQTIGYKAIGSSELEPLNPNAFPCKQSGSWFSFGPDLMDSVCFVQECSRRKWRCLGTAGRRRSQTRPSVTWFPQVSPRPAPGSRTRFYRYTPPPPYQTSGRNIYNDTSKDLIYNSTHNNTLSFFFTTVTCSCIASTWLFTLL